MVRRAVSELPTAKLYPLAATTTSDAAIGAVATKSAARVVTSDALMTRPVVEPIAEPMVKVVVPEPEPAEGPDDIPMAKTYPAGTFDVSGVPNVIVTDPEPGEVIPDPPTGVTPSVVEPGPVVGTAAPAPASGPDPALATRPTTKPAAEPSTKPTAETAPATAEPAPATAEPANAGAVKASLESLIAGYEKKLARNERRIDQAKGDADKMQSLHTRATLDLAAFTRKWYASSREAAGTMDARESKQLSDRFLTLSERSETLLNQFNK